MKKRYAEEQIFRKAFLKNARGGFWVLTSYVSGAIEGVRLKKISVEL